MLTWVSSYTFEEEILHTHFTLRYTRCTTCWYERNQTSCFHASNYTRYNVSLSNPSDGINQKTKYSIEAFCLRAQIITCKMYESNRRRYEMVNWKQITTRFVRIYFPIGFFSKESYWISSNPIILIAFYLSYLHTTGCSWFFLSLERSSSKYRVSGKSLPKSFPVYLYYLT
jgi:hypothetical protein